MQLRTGCFQGGWYSRSHIHRSTCKPVTCEGLNPSSKAGCESIETTVRRRRLLFAGAIQRMPRDRLPKTLMHGVLLGRNGSRGRGRPEGSWWPCLTDNLKVFGIPPESWTDLADDCSGWRQRVAAGAARFMATWREAEIAKAAARHAQAEARSSRPTQTTGLPEGD